MTLIEGEVLFDTNAASAYLRSVPALVDIIDPSGFILVPLAVVGELLYGAHHAGNPNAQLTRVRAFVSRTEIIYPDQETAEIYSREKARLRRTGRMIPENDLWIGATALQYALPLATRDAHFHELDGITVVSW